MLFNSLEYSVMFLPLVVLIFLFLKKFNIALSKVWNLLAPCLCAFGVCIAVTASLGGAAPGSFIYFNF